MLEKINESIEIIVKFAPGKVSPVRFLWRHQVYQLSQINLIHQAGAGADKVIYFSASDNVNFFRLAFHNNDLSWTLEELYYDG